MARKAKQWSRNRSRNRELAELVKRAIGEIEELDGRASAFVKVATIMHRRTLDPTDYQKELLHWIRRRGFVPREVTLGMHFGMLGGLMARGLVVDVEESGEAGVRAVLSLSVGRREAPAQELHRTLEADSGGPDNQR